MKFIKPLKNSRKRGFALVFEDKQLMEQIEQSECFGLFHDPQARECKHCDLQQYCAQKTRENQTKLMESDELNAEVAKLMEEFEKEISITSYDIQTQGDELVVENKAKKKKPNTQNMTVEELWALLDELGGTCEKHPNPVIQKMLLVKEINKFF